MTIINKRAPGRRKKVYYNKGRQVDQLSLDESKVLLKDFFPLQKDMLIEYLHFSASTNFAATNVPSKNLWGSLFR